jgi:hypothetical protein
MKMAQEKMANMSPEEMARVQQMAAQMMGNGQFPPGMPGMGGAPNPYAN